MIWTTRDGLEPDPDKAVEVAKMPWLTYWQGMEQAGDQKTKFAAVGVRDMRMWKVFNWQPRAAEAALKWIATGSFDLASVDTT